MAELHHRTRNLLAVVQSIALQTLRTSASLEGFGDEFESRLQALSRVQGLLARADREAIDLRALVEAELEAHGDGGADPGKVRVEGPPVALPAGSRPDARARAPRARHQRRQVRRAQAARG